MHGKKIVGWITGFTSLLIICLWSYWGINEAFHEGWYSTSFFENLLLTFGQYLSVPLILTTLSLIALYYKKIGFILFIIFGIFALFFFDSPAGRFLIFIPLILFALGYYYGKFQKIKRITFVFISLPLLIMVFFGVPLLLKVEKRLNDHNFGKRLVEGNSVNLFWAPQGVGFPLEGVKWSVAFDQCARLSEEGDFLEEDRVNIWRLPIRKEIVRSLTKNNQNAGGFIDESEIAKYSLKPDKETPLWNPNSKVIYYWTSESKSEEQAYLVSYNGTVLSRNKSSGANYQGFRCVK